MIDYLFWFPIIWILSFILHEYMHCYEHLRQGGHSYHIERWSWHGLPSMRVYLTGIQRDPDMVHLAGGLYTSCIHLVVFFIYVLTCGFHQSGFIYSIICIGLVQWFYGYFEMKCNHLISDDIDTYMLGHYIVYFLVIAVFSVVWMLI